MAVKNLLKDVKNALSIAQAGIKGTLKSLKKAQSKGKTRTTRKPTPKKVASSGVARKPKAKGKTLAKKRDPHSAAPAVEPHKPSKQNPARKSKSKYWP
jgi:hypothetical protein